MSNVNHVDKFGAPIAVGDEIIYTYCQDLRRGTILRFTPRGVPVIGNWPTSRRDPQTGRYVRMEVSKSLLYKGYAKINPTYQRIAPTIEITQKTR
jgi:hypothetical protein